MANFGVGFCTIGSARPLTPETGEPPLSGAGCSPLLSNNFSILLFSWVLIGLFKSWFTKTKNNSHSIIARGGSPAPGVRGRGEPTNLFTITTSVGHSGDWLLWAYSKPRFAKNWNNSKICHLLKS